MRVTVIDDDRDLLDLLRELLTEFGYQVQAYADAWPGIGELIASEPDLIIVDLRLAHQREQLSGLQVAHSARSSTELRDVPIIVCSAASSLEMHDVWPDLMDRGGIQWLQKPFDLLTFQRVVETAMEMNHGTAVPGEAGQILASAEAEQREGQTDG